MTVFSAPSPVPVGFLRLFRTSKARWTLRADGPGRPEVKTFVPARHGEAADWIALAQRKGRNVAVLMAETIGEVTGVQLMPQHLRDTRHAGVRLPLAKAAALDAFRPASFLRLEAGLWVYLVWRLRNQCPVEAVEACASGIAARLGGEAFGHWLPLAGTKHEGAPVQWKYLHQDRLRVLTDFVERRAAGAAPQSRIFVSATDVVPESENWFWPGVFPSGALSLLTGQPKAGKTQISIDCAARVSAGLPWPTDEPCEAGRAAIFELEDKAASSIVPRLQAAGADLRNVVIRDARSGTLNLSEEMPRVAAELERAGGVRLLVLSPLLAFFGTGGADDAEVRRRLRPLLEWAAHTGTAVLGILHPPKSPGKALEAQFAGADTYRRAARAAWVVMPDPNDRSQDEKRRRRAMLCAGINGAADDTRLFFRIKGVTVGGIETSRIDWLHDEAADPREPRAPVQPRPAALHVVARREDAALSPAPASNITRLPTHAVDWLRLALGRGPRPADELKRAALDDGISTAALYRAQKRLGVEILEGGPFKVRTWRLPDARRDV